MRLGRNVLALALITLLGPAGSYPQTANSQGPLDSAKPFLGRWDLTLKTPEREYPSWLEITQQQGQLKARMVGRWGHARLLPKAELRSGQITFVSPKEEEGRKDSDMVFVGTLSGQFLVGTTSGPDGAVWT